MKLERFWLPLGSSYQTASGGWLADPRAGGPWAPNPAAKVTSEFSDRRCLVLLGEPGMGKTHAVESGSAVRPAIGDLEEDYVDLGRYSSEGGVMHRLESAKIRSWLSGSSTMCLTLDGFDECLSRLENLGRLLVDFLETWDCERLYLRIVCRTADWPTALHSDLCGHFGAIDIVELLPLRRSDADLLLRADDLDAAPVLSAVEQVGVVPLAARPLTLELIRSSFARAGSVPETAQALYASGVDALLDETPERRPPLHLPDAVEMRREVAQRLAATSILSGRAAIWTGDISKASAEDLTLDECIPPQSRRGTDPSSEDVGAALRSGVFTGAGEDRLTWAHATFADFLAARWMLDNDLDDTQVQSLLLGSDGRVYARVRHVAAWLVAMEPDRFQHLVKRDPTAFLGVVDLPEESLRETLVRVLLQEVQAGRLFDDYNLDYSGLAHGGLAEQLRPGLRGDNGEVCRIAVNLARANAVTDSLPDLTALALNEKADLHLRSSAAFTVYALTQSSPVHDLAVIVGAASSDVPLSEYQELEAAALMASWPHAISTEDVFAILAPAHRRNFYGVYSIFVHHFAAGLTANDLDAACDWLLANPSYVDDSRVSSLVRVVLRLCVANLDVQKARAVMIAVVLKRIRAFEAPFGDRELDDEPFTLDIHTRRQLATVLLAEASTEDLYVFTLQVHSDPLLQADDLAWLIDRYTVEGGTLRRNLGQVAQELYNPGSVAHSSIVLGLTDDHPAAGLFTFWRSVVDLASEDAIAARTEWQERQQRIARIEERRRPTNRDEWVNPCIAEEAARAAAGRVSAFWYAARLVTVRPGTESYRDQFQPDLTLHPRWADLPELVKSDMVAAARIYVEDGDCSPDTWFTKDVVFFPAQAGYQALVLLLRHDPAALDQISAEAWRKWAPILIDWTVMTNGASEEDKRRLLDLARPHAEVELRASLLALVDRSIMPTATEDEAHLFLSLELEALSSEQLAQELIERLKQPIPAATRRSLVDFLIVHHPDEVTPLVRSWLDPQARQDDPERAHEAAFRLLRQAAAASWPDLKTLLDDDPAFMETALLNGGLAFDRHVPDLSPRDLAVLYLWVCKRFPSDEDPDFEEAHTVGAREALGRWRDAILRSLQTAGTPDAVAAVAYIAERSPDKPWMSRVLLEAKNAQREQSWEPLTAADLDQLAESRRSYVIRSDADLLAVTLSALDEIQARLQSDTPAAYLLWDTHSQRPKSEEEVSDYLAIELEQRLSTRGVVVNREVQVRRVRPAGLPERTDLRIEASRPDDDATGDTRTLRLPIEVKGAWNQEVTSSLRSQLVERYMADFQTNHGVYVVAWFDPASWTTEDRRRRKVAELEGIAELRETLLVEAGAERVLGRVVAVQILDCSLRRPTQNRDEGPKVTPRE